MRSSIPDISKRSPLLYKFQVLPRNNFRYHPEQFEVLGSVGSANFDFRLDGKQAEKNVRPDVERKSVVLPSLSPLRSCTS